jgi:hypothetical protein
MARIEVKISGRRRRTAAPGRAACAESRGVRRVARRASSRAACIESRGARRDAPAAGVRSADTRWPSCPSIRGAAQRDAPPAIDLSNLLGKRGFSGGGVRLADEDYLADTRDRAEAALRAAGLKAAVGLEDASFWME